MATTPVPQVDDLLRAALDAFHQGQFAVAHQRCEQALQLRPEHPGATYIQGVTALRLGRTRMALRLLRSVEPHRRGDVQFLAALGEAAFRESRLEEAAQSLRRAVELAPDDVAQKVRLSTVLMQLERAGEARELLSMPPVDASTVPEVLNNLGAACEQEGDLEAAAEHYRAAAERAPQLAVAWSNLGRVQAARGLHDEAEQPLSRAAALAPDDWATRLELARVWIARGESARGEAELKAVARIAPGGAVLAELGELCRAGGRVQEAIDAYGEALAREPGDAALATTLGSLQLRAGALEEAEQLLLRVLEGQPEYAPARANLGRLRLLQGEPAAATEALERALAGMPVDAECHYQYAEALYAAGRDTEAWAHYEWRWRRDTGEAAPMRRPGAARRWNGQDLSGSTLLLSAEQGLGDEVLFAACVPAVQERAGRVILECIPKLAPLLARSLPGVDVHPVDRRAPGWEAAANRDLEAAGGADFHLPVGSLPHRLGEAGAALPFAHGRYLHTDPEQVGHWRNRLEALGSGPRVGVSWRGGTEATGAAARSIPVEALAQLREVPGVRLVSLQYGDCAEDRERFEAATGLELVHWQEAIDHLDETAALADALDAVVTVNTAAAHLAGALGRPTWVLLPRYQEAFHLFSESRSWYRSLRVLRQERAGDWSGPVARAVAGLRAVF
jgi:tetratricopeptide (TPR) repeat protein